MGKYRIGLVIFSFVIIYVDVYVNKQTTSYFVSSTVFFAMLLYDYEKLGKTEDKFKKLVSVIGSYTYAILAFLNVIFMTCALFKQVSFIESKDLLFNLKLQVFGFPAVGIGVPFCFLFVWILAITFLEVFSEREKKTITTSAA